MLTLARALFVIFALGIFAAEYAWLRPAASADGDSNVRDLEDRLNEAIVQGDVATFDRLFADDFTHTSQDGTFRTRAEWLKGRVQGKSNYVSYEVADRQIRVYGETAVVTGLAKPSWREDDGSLASGKFRLLRVWVKRAGHWQVVAFQSTRISEKKE
jgi:ketosteroid isomerase-like protein